MGWDTKDLREDLKTLKKSYRAEKDTVKKEYILKAINSTILNISEIELEKINTFSSHDIWQLIKNIPTYDMFYPDIRKFINTLHRTDYEYRFDKDKIRTKNKISFSDVDELVHEFYKSTPRRIYSKFLEIEKNKDTTINYIENVDAREGVTYLVPILNKRYMQIGTKGDRRELVSTLIHEYGHAIAHFYNTTRYISDDSFTEIEAIFMELIGADFLREQTNDDYYKKFLQRKTCNYYWEAVSILSFKRVFDNTFSRMTDSDDAINLCTKYLSREGFDPKKVSIDIDEDMKYLYSYICAVELFEIYKEDKELAINLLKRIVNRNKKETEYDNLHTVITPVKSLKKHLKRIYEE